MVEFYPKLSPCSSIIPTKAHDMLKCPLPKYSSSTMDEALTNPDNQSVFLTASMAFLQTQLLKKMESNESFTSNEFQRTYSDLLIFEFNTNEYNQKSFVRVKNTEKYDEIMRNEKCLPTNALSLDQILPLPKSSLQKRRDSITNFFKIKPSHSITNILKHLPPKHSFSVMSLFKKQTKTEKCRCSLNFCEDIKFKTEEFDDDITIFPSEFRKKITPRSKYTTSNTFHRDNSKIKEEFKMDEKVLSFRNKLKKLNFSSDSSNSYKYISKEHKYRHAPKQVYYTYNNVVDYESVKEFTTCRKILKERNSKLSVCIEDESDTEESSGYESYEHKYSCNLTDEIKSNISSKNNSFTP